MTEPPSYVIAAANFAARESPCQKSRRGVCVFNPFEADRLERTGDVSAAYRTAFIKNHVIAGVGFNGPPGNLLCDGSADCRSNCNKFCVHAEVRAIRAAGILDDVHDLDLVHVKVDEDGGIVAGGPPSCWQCSREILDVGVRGVWLYEGQTREFTRHCSHCDYKHVWTVPAGQRADDGDAATCPNCKTDLSPVASFEYIGAGAWKFYTARDFHYATLRYCGIPGAPT